MRRVNYRILLRKEPEGGYTVTVPTLPGRVTFGDTIEEAIAMAKEAIELYLEDLTERGEEIPTKEDTLEYTLTVEAQPKIPFPPRKKSSKSLRGKGLSWYEPGAATTSTVTWRLEGA